MSIQMNLRCEPGLMELTAKNPATKEIIAAYIRDHSTTIVKELEGEILRGQTFGSGPLQLFREMYLKADPISRKAIEQKIYGGIICNGDSTR